MSSTAPVFIVGTPRSGTTLLARILGRHPSLFMHGETHFFPDIYARRAELGDPPSAEGALAMKERLSTLYGRYNEPADQARVARIFSDAGSCDCRTGASSTSSRKKACCPSSFRRT